MVTVGGTRIGDGHLSSLPALLQRKKIMRLATVRTPEGIRAVRVEADRLVELPFPDVRAVLETGGDWLERAAATKGRNTSFADASFAPLIPNPSKIFCIGFNYLEHIREMGQEPPQHPSIFAKFARALIGAYDPIAMPQASEQVDWEVELGAIVGRPVRRAGVDEARDAIAGYTICNDMSVRDWQFRTRQALQGKTWEHMTPIGPVLVTPDELDDARNVRVQCLVDGQVMQDSSTADLQFSPAELVSYISTFITLDPGDVICTGSPAGVGFSRKPQVFLRPGNVVTTRIERIGELVNPCVDERDWRPAGARTSHAAG